MSENLKRKAETKIRALTDQLQKTDAQLAKMQQEHYAAALAYGSELCAGDMDRKEEALESKMRQISADIQSLQKLVNGTGAAAAPIADLESRLAALRQKRAASDREIKQIEEQIADAKRLDDLLK